MLQIKVKENESVEKALKRFKKKFERTRVLRQLRSRKQFTKKSVDRRFEVLKAKYIQKTYGGQDD
jgi:small subunit ribosomal protein S21